MDIIFVCYKVVIMGSETYTQVGFFHDKVVMMVKLAFT